MSTHRYNRKKYYIIYNNVALSIFDDGNLIVFNLNARTAFSTTGLFIPSLGVKSN